MSDEAAAAWARAGNWRYAACEAPSTAKAIWCLGNALPWERAAKRLMEADPA